MNGKNWLKGIIMAAVLAGCFVASAAAADMSVGVGTVTGEGLRLRQEPSLDGAVIISAHKDERVMVLEQTGDWYKVDYATQEGYMSAAFVDVTTSLEADLGYGMVTTGGGVLNLRSAPGMDSDKVTTIPCRTVVSIAGFQDGWYKITYNGLTGYVSSEYITLVDAEGKRADGSTDAPAASDLGQRIVDEAMKHVGKPYVYATHGPNSFDCSGFTHYCVKQASGGSIVLSTGSVQQWTSAPGQRIYSTDQLQPGDLFFIDDPAYGGNYKVVTHVAIYAGNGMLVHASSGKTGVIVNPIKDKDYRYFVGAIRLG